jgi:formylglycine-generating enzyme required for sulfatase activity
MAVRSTRLVCDPSFGTWTEGPGANETLPINCIDWYEAYAFCIWDGGFLPSEAEWEAAAGGGPSSARILGAPPLPPAISI